MSRATRVCVGIVDPLLEREGVSRGLRPPDAGATTFHTANEQADFSFLLLNALDWAHGAVQPLQVQFAYSKGLHRSASSHYNPLPKHAQTSRARTSKLSPPTPAVWDLESSDSAQGLSGTPCRTWVSTPSRLMRARVRRRRCGWDEGSQKTSCQKGWWSMGAEYSRCLVELKHHP